MNKTTLLRFLNSLNKLDNKKKEFRILSELPLYLNDVLIGLLLSDGHLERTSSTSFVRLSISFGVKHLEYLLYLYKLFESYTNTSPTTIDVLNKKINTIHQVCKFKTVSLPQLLYYHNLFYKLNDNNKLIKIIPHNICDLMSPIVLAHLIMGDGNLKKLDNIIRIYTNSFTKDEVELLVLAIKTKLNIEAKAVHDRNNQYMITISKYQLELVKELLIDHMHPSMYYKLGLEPINIEEFILKDKSKLNKFSKNCTKLSV